MATEIRVPVMGESVTEATVGQWLKQVGEAVKMDEPLVELETDKVAQEVLAPKNGVLTEIVTPDGETVEIGALLAMFEEGAAGTASAAPAEKAAPAATPVPAEKSTEMPASPAAQKMMTEEKLSDVAGSGKRGQVLKEDVIKAVATAANSTPAVARAPSSGDVEPREERVRMTRLRQTIAKRLKDAQNTAAMLTTFNEVDMGNIMAVRKEYKELFEKKHGVKLGFMSFFVKACIGALKDVPAVNAEIDGTDLIYKNYYHMGVAVGTEKGLVVPVLRDADMLSLAGIEKAINAMGTRARDGKLGIEDMQGGTFTISKDRKSVV